MNREEIMRACFELDANGNLVWAIRPRHFFACAGDYNRFNSCKAGTRVKLRLSDQGYVSIGVTVLGRGYRFLAHRIVWLLVNGSLPAEIDHINGNRSDNRIENLRPSSRTHNLRNAALRSDNKTGVCGVYKRKNRFCAEVVLTSGTRKWVGSFKTVSEAAEAVAKVRVEHGYTARHGTRP